MAAEPTPGVSLTVYNNNFAVVKVLRMLNVPEEISTIQLQDVARDIDPTSVHFKSLTDPEGTTVLEQNYEFDLLSADNLLEKYIDRLVVVVTQDGERYEGKLLSFDARQLVIQGDDKLSMVQRSDNVRNLEFGKLPEGLLTRPTLLWKVAADKPGQHLSQVTYQTSSVTWQADYTAVINPGDTQMDMTGWVTISNRSGADYKAARIKLIAGDVRRIEAPQPEKARRKVVAMAQTEPGFVEKPFFEYHLYTLGRATDINDNQIKQIELLSAAAIPVVKRFVFEPGGRYWHRRHGQENLFKTNVYVEFNNDRDSNMGMPLPKGKVRLYKADPEDGELEFIGEDQIDHTPRDEQLRLYIGDAFDVVGERTVSNRKQDERWREESIRIELRNHKDEPITIQVRERLSHRGQWEVTARSADFKKIDATTIQFDIPVEKHDKAELTYTVFYRW
jgi:hypothetical protein